MMLKQDCKFSAKLSVVSKVKKVNLLPLRKDLNHDIKINYLITLFDLRNALYIQKKRRKTDKVDNY